MVEVSAQHVKPIRVPLRYPYIIYSNSKHCATNCPRKIKVQNMFWTKQTNIAIIVTKNLKLDHVPVNVVVVTTCS